METNQYIDLPNITSSWNNYLKCEKCNYILEYTIFNSSNGVKIYSEYQNRHLNISLLD